jgi:hypothetical protein
MVPGMTTSVPMFFFPNQFHTHTGEGAAVPKTFAVCRDLDYLYAKASTAHNKLHKLQEKLAEQCKKVSKIIKTCNKIDKIKEQTGTAESTLKTLKNLPYIGPVLNLIYPIVRNVKEGTKVASNCKKFVKNLNLKNLKKNCKKAVRRMKDADMRISLIFADLEVVQELWCSCKAEQTEYQADVKRGCERAEEIYKSGNEKFGNCTEPVKCPLKSNARALAIRCPNTVRPVVEKFSDIVDQDVARLRVAVDTHCMQSSRNRDRSEACCSCSFTDTATEAPDTPLRGVVLFEQADTTSDPAC